LFHSHCKINKVDIDSFQTEPVLDVSHSMLLVLMDSDLTFTITCSVMFPFPGGGYGSRCTRGSSSSWPCSPTTWGHGPV